MKILSLYTQKGESVQQEQISLDLSKSSGIECECGSVFFKQSLVMRKFSRFLTGTPQDHIQPVIVFRCEDCGRPSKHYFPEGMLDLEEKFGFTKVETLPEPGKIIKMP